MIKTKLKTQTLYEEDDEESKAVDGTSTPWETKKPTSPKKKNFFKRNNKEVKDAFFSD